LSHELVLVVVTPELVKDLGYDLDAYVYNALAKFDHHEPTRQTEAVDCGNCVDGHVSDGPDGICGICGGSGASGRYENPDGRYDSFVIGGRFGVHYLQLSAERTYARLALTNYEDMPPDLRGPTCYGAEIAAMYVLVAGDIHRWPLRDDMRDPSWYYVICDAHC